MKDKLKSIMQKILPRHAVGPLLLLVFSNLIVYYGARAFNMLMNREYLNMTGRLDGIIPPIPAFVIFYVLAYPFWYITYYLICRSDAGKARRVVWTDVAAKLFCGLIFILIPTTMSRPSISSDNFCGALLNAVYASDAPDNLFPSIHCLESWICFLAIRDEEKVPDWVKISAFVLAVLICLSTVFTKQHVLIDGVAGVLIADIAWKLEPLAVRAEALKGRRNFYESTYHNRSV